MDGMQLTAQQDFSATPAEVVAMLLEDGEPKLDAQFIGTEQLRVA